MSQDGLDIIPLASKRGGNRIRVGDSPRDHYAARFADLCDRYGVKRAETAPVPDAVECSAQDALGLMRDQRLAVSLKDTRTDLIGRVGTSRSGGLTRDPSARFGPTTVRGRSGNHGLYKTYKTNESMIADAAASITELVASASAKILPPRRVRRSQQAAVQGFVDAQNAALNRFICLEGGFKRYILETLSFCWAGFATSEPIFEQANGIWVWRGAQPRIQSTVQRWYTAGDDLFAVAFQSGASDDLELTDTAYTLPFACTKAIDRRLILHRIGGYGLEYEGDPPTRSSLHWVDFKQLISQIAPASIEKYGAGLTLVKIDPAFMTAINEGEDIPDLEDAWEIFNGFLAQDVPGIQLPPGVTIEHVTAQGTPPDFLSWLQYCDQMIAFPFSSEGNLRGLSNAVGSYAQSEVSERRYLRSAPKYQALFTDPINEQIIKPLCDMQITGPPLLEYPRLEMSSAHQSENSAWVDQVLKAVGPNTTLNAWPPELRDIFYEKMGVTSSGVDVVEDVIGVGDE